MSFRFIFLSSVFYQEYSDCPEIGKKSNRPYVCLLTEVDGVNFAIPMRSHINHSYCYLTDVDNRCGVDYSKAIVLSEIRYIDKERKPYIRKNEFDALRGKEYIIESGMRKYLRSFRKAMKKPDVPRNATLIQYSTLKYFIKLL